MRKGIILSLTMTKTGILIFLLLSFLGLVVLTYVIYRIMWHRLQGIIEEGRQAEEKQKEDSRDGREETDLS